MERMQMSSGEGNRPWNELIPDALALIFKKISFQEILTVVPAVCKSWRKAAMEPDCWQEIYIEDWCRSCKTENRDKMVKMLISRSGGSMRILSVFGLTNDPIFAFIAGSAHSLQTLRMPMSEVTDSIVTQMAPKLATITYLDISNCEKMTSSSLEALGKHCKFLTRLSRNMHPQGTVGQSPKDDEAFAIAKYMPRLKHLELAHGLLTDAGMEAILSMCKDLEHLDIRGCENVVIQDSLAEQCRNLKVFLGPVVYDYDSDSFHLQAALDERLYIGYFEQVTMNTGMFLLLNNSVSQDQRGAANGLAMTGMSLFKTFGPAGGGSLFALSQKRQHASFLPGDHMVFFVINVIVLVVFLMTFEPFLPQSTNRHPSAVHNKPEGKEGMTEQEQQFTS